MLQEGKKMIFTDFLHCNGYQNSCNVIHDPVQGKKEQKHRSAVKRESRQYIIEKDHSQ